MRDVALERDDRLDHALVVEHDLRLLQVEVDRPAPVPAAVQDLEQRVHPLEERDQVVVAPRLTSGSRSVRMAFTSV